MEKKGPESLYTTPFYLRKHLAASNEQEKCFCRFGEMPEKNLKK